MLHVLGGECRVMMWPRKAGLADYHSHDRSRSDQPREAMSVTDELTEIERRILVTLNDAGEEYVSALINTVIECEGNHSEVTSVIDALRKFLHGSFVGCAIARDTNTLELIKLAESEANHLLNALPEQISWSQEDSLWIWTASQPRLVVLLTNSGKSMSHKVVTGTGAERIRAFLIARAKDPRWYKDYR